MWTQDDEQEHAFVLSACREEPARKALVAAEEPVTTEELRAAVVTPGGVPEGHRLLLVPAGEGHTGGQAGM